MKPVLCRVYSGSGIRDPSRVPFYSVLATVSSHHILLTKDVTDQTDETVARLVGLKEALFSAEPVLAELDRGLRVLMPSEASRQVQLPQDFFSMSADEIKREQQARLVKQPCFNN